MVPIRTLLLAASLLVMNALTAQGNCAADAGTLTGYKPSDCLQNGGTVIGAVANGDALVPPGYQTLYVLTSGPDLVIEQVSAYPVFTVTTENWYTIHTLVYDPATLDLSIVQFGTTTGGDVNALLVQGGGTICASLDVQGTSVNVENPSAGTLEALEPEVCWTNGGNTIGATVDIAPEVPFGYSVLYVLTEGAGLVIQQVSATPSFTVNAIGEYTIHTLVYDPATLDLSIVVPGSTTGFDVNGLLVQGGGGICAALDVAGAPVKVSFCDEPCVAEAGTLTGYKPSDCLQSGGTVIGAVTNGDALVPPGYQTLYVLTSGPDLVIEQVSAYPVFTVTTENWYTIHTLVYDPATLDLSIVQFGTTTGGDVNALLVQGGGTICASLDVQGTSVNVENPSAGTLEALEPEVCWTNGGNTIGATVDISPEVPFGYSVLYVLTEGAGLVIQQVSATPSFTVNAIGEYTIHTLVYDPATLDLSIVVPGTTTGFDVNGLLVQGGGGICAALDVAGAPVKVSFCDDECLAYAGTLVGVAEVPCLSSDSPTAQLSAVPNGDAIVPAGYSVLYVLTQGAGLVIVDVNTTPDFVVGTAGDYTIHTLVFDANTLDLSIVDLGVTTGFDVNGLLIQGGGAICASLDVAGAPIPVLECPPPGCTVSAGELASDADGTLCLDGGSATVTASVVEPPTVPAGYQVLYVLTRGLTPVIEAVGPTPSFDVTSAGLWTIHTLVYDPSTLDLSIVQFGVTTGLDVDALLVQGGGSICAALELPGAGALVEECVVVCDADAGSLSGATEVPCLEVGNNVLLEASPNGDAVEPAGFSTIYVLTSGAGLVIQDVSVSPMFMVNLPGLYTIHTLVYDAGTLDLSIVELGVTTGFDVNSLLVQGGGAICASLDVAGAAFNVVECPPLVCEADAGTLEALLSEPCLQSGSALVLEAAVAAPPVVPAGYSTLYVLTQGAGLVIEAVNTAPSFSVTAPGAYTIHTLVYDATTLDLSIVEFGVTTGFDVNALLVQGGGAICASLDVAGAAFTVVECDNGGNLTLGLESTAVMEDAVILLGAPAAQRARISVVDVLGQRAVRTIDVELARGVNRLSVDMRATAPGQYLVVLETDGQRSSNRFVKQ